MASWQGLGKGLQVFREGIEFWEVLGEVVEGVGGSWGKEGRCWRKVGHLWAMKGRF